MVRSICAAKAKDADITQEWSDAFKEKWDGKEWKIADTRDSNGVKFAA